MSEHTPGPWSVGDMQRRHDQWLELPVHVGDAASRGNAFAVVYMGGEGAIRNEPAPLRANANLISAAPELLEALRECVDALSGYAKWYGHRIERIDRARAAIAKATGGEQ